jgi:hypothetical protein
MFRPLTKRVAVLFYSPVPIQTSWQRLQDIDESPVVSRYSRDALAIKLFQEDGFKLPDWADEWLTEHYLERLAE